MYSMSKRCIAAYVKNDSIKNCNTVQVSKKTNQPFIQLAEKSKRFAKHNLKTAMQDVSKVEKETSLFIVSGPSYTVWPKDLYHAHAITTFVRENMILQKPQ